MTKMVCYECYAVLLIAILATVAVVADGTFYQQLCMSNDKKSLLQNNG